MRLLLKFNVIFLLIFLAGLAASAHVSRNLLLANAQEEIVQHARLTMEKAIAVRTYTVDQIRPHLIKQLDEVFLPQTVPAFAATEAVMQLQKKYPNDPSKNMG